MMNSLHALLFSLIALAPISLAAEKEATVRLKVTDEFGKPVPHADMLVLFCGYQMGQDTEVVMKTNAHGVLVAKGWPKSKFMAYVKVFSEAPGYYESKVQAGSATEHDLDLKLLIRKKEDPIAMYAKKVELELPEQRKEIGFDFEKGDWVKPHGKGEIADFTFLGEKFFEDDKNFETSVVMSYSNDLEGMQLDSAQQNNALQNSEFKTSRIAPIEGYASVYNFVRKKEKGGRNGSTDMSNYIFRSRVVLDESGKIKSCHYGKMIDAVNVARGSGIPDANPIVKFTYYFNPTPNDRNLEFEPKLNLFPAADGMIEVGQP